MRVVLVFVCLVLLSRTGCLYPLGERVRIRRQDQGPDMSQMQPWMELGMKYGKLSNFQRILLEKFPFSKRFLNIFSAATEILMPMAQEAWVIAGEQFGPGSGSSSSC